MIMAMFVSTAAIAEDVAGGTSSSVENKTTGDATARGTANFTMSFSGSAQTVGKFIADTFGQNLNDVVVEEDK